MFNKDVWLFPQNSCNINQFFLTLKFFDKMNGINRKNNLHENLMKNHFENGLYNPYIVKEKFDVSSANHKIDEPRFYGAIYETPNKKIHVSSYGELLLKYENDLINRNKIFIAMLFNLQFDNPVKKMQGFNIYPLRLIFKLLTEEKLERKLYNFEIANILYYVREIKDKKDYLMLIENILLFRNNSQVEKIKILSKNSQQYIKNHVSCTYLCNILKDIEIIKIDKKEEDFKLKSPVRKKSTNIKYVEIQLRNDYIKFVENILKENTIYDPIKKMIGLKSEWISEIYNTISETLLNEINEKEEVYTELLQIPKLLIDTSVDSNKWDQFEEYITKSFNLFEDIKAETISGPGQPDTLCYFTEKEYSFCVDGKSTKNKLNSINDGRLSQHRKLYSAKYTIIVTPAYVPSALYDIKGTDTCIITSYCFADLITKFIFKLYKNKQNCSFGVLDELILDNLGTDISDKIYKLIDDNIGVSKEILKKQSKNEL